MVGGSFRFARYVGGAASGSAPVGVVSPHGRATVKPSVAAARVGSHGLARSGERVYYKAHTAKLPWPGVAVPGPPPVRGGRNSDGERSNTMRWEHTPAALTAEAEHLALPVAVGAGVVTALGAMGLFLLTGAQHIPLVLPW